MKSHHISETQFLRTCRVNFCLYRLFCMYLGCTQSFHMLGYMFLLAKLRQFLTDCSYSRMGKFVTNKWKISWNVTEKTARLSWHKLRKTNIAPQKWCLGDKPFLLGFGLFSEALAVSFLRGYFFEGKVVAESKLTSELENPNCPASSIVRERCVEENQVNLRNFGIKPFL